VDGNDAIEKNSEKCDEGKDGKDLCGTCRNNIR